MAALAFDFAAMQPPYWALATTAEARLVLGDAAGAVQAYAAAAALAGGRYEQLASTRRQARWLAAALGIELDLEAALPAPPVLHWVAEPALQRIAARPAAGFAFGAILSPADIMVAEALLAAAAHLELVLPCAAAAWQRALPADWARRFASVCRRAAAVVPVTEEGDPREATAGRLAVRQAHGAALLRAAALEGAARQVRFGADGQLRDDGADPADFALPDWADAHGEGRHARALLFADVRGFSKLNEAAQLVFLERVIGAFADTLAELGEAVDYAETAGDGLYVVLRDVVAAARGALALQGVVQPARIAAMGLPAHLALRVGAHVGPVYRRYDRVIGRHRFCGTEVIRTARIEPVTPAGTCYVTEQFAAALQSAAPGRFACNYVGRHKMAKGFGKCRFYALREIFA
jgi:class 3 adenylate cyclase